MSEPQSPEAERLRLAFDMHDFGLRLYAQRLRREQPEASEAEIEAQVCAWLNDRPLDAPGRPRQPSV